MASFGVSALDANAAGAAAAPASALTVGDQVAFGKPAASSTALTAVGIVGNITAVLVLAIPYFIFVKPVRKAKSVGAWKPYGFVMMLTNCMFWILFALPAFKHSLLVLGVNAAGVVIQGVYIAVYLWYAPAPSRRTTVKLLLGVLAICTVLAVLVIWFVMVKKVWSIRFMGVIASSFTTLMFVVGLVADMMELEEGRAGQIVFQLVVNMMNAAIWTSFGFLSAPANAFVVVPNVLGVACTAVDMAARLIYSKLTTSPAARAA
ncbi:hypothetical protein CFC21_058899 [Triticum aestivum]|uniref:Bidirectional sugar transporter SWEET n=2 Tax=Triticum aestivum TaxID=4565 RepID=A0A9R1KDX6_WHEAT|nr:bidirectional sugar transporter SWEET4-like [Triticum aestivum]KAF7050544.1 hypothetical protein CFC21_058899 [Triticum aestivum]